MTSPSSTPQLQLPSAPITAPQPRRPIQREGAVILLSPEEQALEDAMMMPSSPPPEPVVRKRPRAGDADGSDDEGEATAQAPQPQQTMPSVSNIAAAAKRYATHKKLRAEQREEVDAFLLVSRSLINYFLCVNFNIPQDTAAGRQVKMFIALLSVENKVDTFRSSAPPYQVSEELKV